MDENPIPRFGVSGFVELINQVLEFSCSAVEIEGEVASFKVNQGKWVFFDLKDEEASVGCFMPVYQLRTPIEDGMKLVVRAQPKVTKSVRMCGMCASTTTSRAESEATPAISPGRTKRPSYAASLRTMSRMRSMPSFIRAGRLSRPA